MSSEPVTATEHKPGRLRADVLHLPEMTLSALANIGPALSLYFVLGVMVAGAGSSAPLAVLAGTASILFVAWSLVLFSREKTTAGSYVTWIGGGLGKSASRFALVLVVLGGVVAGSGVFVGISALLQIIIANWSKSTGPWWVYTLTWIVLTLVLVVRGVRIAARAAAALFLFEVAVLVALAIATLAAAPSSQLTATPLTLGSTGMSGLAAAFPAVVLLFLGWENAAALSEESRRPHRNVGRSAIIAILLAGLIAAFIVYAAVVGYGSLTALARDPSPLDTLAAKHFGSLHVLVDFAVLASAFSLSLAAVNSGSRIVFNAGRTGDLPRQLARVNDRYSTPHWAIVGLTVIAGAVGLIWTLVYHGQPFEFVEVAFTLGPVLFVIVYALLCVSVAAFFWRRHRHGFNWWHHVLVPAVGVAVLVKPFYESTKPGQPYPLNILPVATAVAVGLAVILVVGRYIQTRQGVRSAPAVSAPAMQVAANVQAEVGEVADE